jgi:hypothetical protein
MIYFVLDITSPSFSFLYPLLSNANLELMFFGADFLPGRVWPVLLRVTS